MELIDTHCHVSYPDFDHDRDAVLKRAAQAGVALMVTVATDPACWHRYLDLSEGRPQLRVALGFHPNHAETFTGDDFLTLKSLFAKHPGKAVAVGETGLDFFREHCAPDIQRCAFQAQLDLAAELDLPFILHCRKAEREMLDMLAAQQAKQKKPLRGVWHCFSANPELMREAAGLGLYFGFGGILTYVKAQEVRDAAKEAPADKLLLETDAPYLPPQPWRGQRNEPAYVAETARKLAEVRGVSTEDIARITTENARHLFRLAA